jgi:hypothetical protein
MDGVNMGLGIGLSGRLDAPGRVFAAQQQEQAYRRKANLQKQKEQDAEVDELVKGVLKERGKYHELVSPEINREVGDTMKKLLELKINNPTNYASEAYNLFYGDPNTNAPGLFQKADLALSRSEQLKQLENVSEKRKRGEFVSPSQEAAVREMKNYPDYQSWVAGLNEKKISDDFFTLNPETGEFTFKETPAIDFKKYSTDIIGSNKNNILSETTTEGTVGGQKYKTIKTVTGVPRSKEEARQLREEYIAKNKTTAGAPPLFSGEDAAEQLFQNPVAKLQYQAVHPETKSMNDDQIKDHYLKTYFDPYEPYKQTASTIKESKGVNITNQVGGDDLGREFIWSKEKGNVPGTAIQYSGTGYLNVNVAPKAGQTFVLQGSIKSNDGSSYSPKSQASAKEIKFGRAYVVRTATDKSGNKRLLPEGQKPNPGETAKYETMVETSFSDLKFTKATEELFKETILIPFNQANEILSTQTMTKYTRGAYSKTVNEMDTYSKQLSNTPK